MTVEAQLRALPLPVIPLGESEGYRRELQDYLRDFVDVLTDENIGSGDSVSGDDFVARRRSVMGL